MKSSIPRAGLIIALGALLIGSTVGYIIGQHQASTQAASFTLRSDSYQFVKPILFSDYGNDITSPELTSLEEQVSGIISRAKTEGLQEAAVYYRDLNVSQQMVLNNNLKFFPASLTKLPLMLSYYHLDEKQLNFLQTTGSLEFSQDYNAGQEIQPGKSPQSGQEYSIQQLIDMMIVHSDNTSFQLLTGNQQAIDVMRKLFSELKIEYPLDQTDNLDVLTIKEFARFYRVLYNATYLTPKKSEEALQLLSQVVYSNGITAGLPQGTAVAHKYGLHTYRDPQTGVVAQRQLHDCGIVYDSSNPYLLCVMTKGQYQDLSAQEKLIADISRAVYDYRK